MATVIPKLKFSEPRHNLPGRKGIATLEDRFTISFARTYLEQRHTLHAGSNRTEMAVAREIPVNGYGIADLMAVAWNPTIASDNSLEDFVSSGMITSRAFECKISDWRGALTQGGRYRYFAHQAIVVLPEKSCRLALPFLDTFQAIKVGLWSFDMVSKKITIHHTPRPIAPKSKKYFEHSMKLTQKAVKGSLPFL